METIVAGKPFAPVSLSLYQFCGHKLDLPAGFTDMLSREQGLVTVAALFSPPNLCFSGDFGDGVLRYLGDERTQAVAYLAMWATGKMKVVLPVRIFRTLERRALDYANKQFQIGQGVNGNMAMFARDMAVDLAKQKGVIGNRTAGEEALAETDFANGRGFGVMDEGLSEDFDRTQPADVRLLTTAGMFAHITQQLTNESSQAIVFLSLYAANAHVQLTKEQFRLLERRVRKYLRNLDQELPGHKSNGDRAHFVLVTARDRARRENTV